MPEMPDGVQDGILKGMYRFRAASKPKRGAARAAVRQRRDPARGDQGAGDSRVASTTSRPMSGASRATPSSIATATRASAGTCCIPADSPRVPYVTQCLKDAPGVLVAASDYVKAMPDSIDRWLPRPLTVLGTDGFGRSETPRLAARVLRSGLPLRDRRHAGGARARRQDRRVDRRSGDQGAQHQSREGESREFVMMGERRVGVRTQSRSSHRDTETRSHYQQKTLCLCVSVANLLCDLLSAQCSSEALFG